MNSNESPNVPAVPDAPNEANAPGNAIAPVAAPTISKLPLLAAAAHGFFFVVTGLWPLVSLDTFEAVSGAKTDDWLVITVGLLVVVIGGTLLLAAVRRNVGLEMFVLGLSAAFAFVGVDVVFIIKQAISWVYLLDAVAEMLFITLWIFAAKARRAARAV